MVKKNSKKKKSVMVYSKGGNDSTLWIILTLIFAVLFVASIFTSGFNFNKNTSVNSVIENINTLKTSTDNEHLKQTLTSFEKELEAYKVETSNNKDNTNVVKTVDKPVKVDFYVMSKCPYGRQVVDAIDPVLKQLGENVDFNLNYIASDLGDGNFKSLHGESEVKGDIVQLCAIKYNSDHDKYMDMLVCQNKNAGGIPDNWEVCAKDAGLDVEKIRACYEGDEGKQLLSQSTLKAIAVKASGSPTIYINDEPYQGGRSERDFLVSICNAYQGERPQVCEDIPKPQVIDLTVVNDKQCPNCDPSKLIGALKQLFPGLRTRTVDVASVEGKELVKTYNLELAPSYIFDSKVADEDAFKSNAQLAAVFEKKGDNYKLLDQATGAKWFISEEKRAEALKIIGIKKGDNLPQIDFYVMSFCPYGNQAEETIEPVYQKLKGLALFKPQYVIYNQGTGCVSDKEGNKYCSLHGAQELNQDVREQCVEKYYGIDDWFKFALEINNKCTSKNADTCWEAVAKDLGYDTEKIKTCEANEKFDFLKADYKLNQLLGVRGSPTVYIEGEEYSGPRTAKGYMSALCTGYEDAPEACNDITVETPATTTPTTGQC